MQIIKRTGDLRTALEPLRARGLALVPTMGALHAGHLALVAEARRRAGAVAVSIFVNPLQFNQAGDLASYPRQEAADLALLEEAGCDVAWLPEPGDLYPPGFATTVSVAGIGERWEGEHRPGHFDGVATVVTKLLAAVRPDVALFGEKDFQQLALIRRLAADLDLGVAIADHPTVRDGDGLALSSRNALLAAGDRARAVALPRALEQAAHAIAGGADVGQSLAEARSALAEAGFGPIDYVALVDAATLEPLTEAAGEMRLIAAASIGGVRLIDNMRVISDTARRQGN